MAEDDAQKMVEQGEQILAQLRALDEKQLAQTLESIIERGADGVGGLAAALFVALRDERRQPTSRPAARSRGDRGAATAALGATAALTGHTGDLYKAARMSSNVRAVEKTMVTGNPKYVERRVKNKVVGRSMGKAGVWRKLWR
jgi:hypothetical protein